MSDFAAEYAAASTEVPRDPLMHGDIEDQVRVLALSLKPCRNVPGVASACGMAGIIMAGLHDRGWDVVKRA